MRMNVTGLGHLGIILYAHSHPDIITFYNPGRNHPKLNLMFVAQYFRRKCVRRPKLVFVLLRHQQLSSCQVLVPWLLSLNVAGDPTISVPEL